MKAQLSQNFNELVMEDLFFLWDQCFMLLIDECIRWKTGDHVDNKRVQTLLKAIIYLWIRVWGPMQTLLIDQEGGLVGNESTAFFDNLQITRAIVGTEASTAKGLVERHIQITKLSMLRLRKSATTTGLDLSYSDLCQECCMSQNLLLEYAGGTPQVALTGFQRGTLISDLETMDIATGALQTRPDIAETFVRTRNLAKQAILQAPLEERMAEA